MSDEDRREWIAERAAIIFEGSAGEIDYFTAMKKAAEMYQDSLITQQALF